MALLKQVIPIPIFLGLDTKHDPKQEEPGKLDVAENVIYETTRRLDKRRGYNALVLDCVGNDQLSDVKKLDVFKNELIAFEPGTLHTFSPSIEKWVNKGPVYSVFPTSTPIIRNARQQDQLDCGITENLKISVWHDDQNEIRYSVSDKDTNGFLVSNDLVATGSTRPRVGVIQNFVYVIYAQGSDVKYRRFNILSPQDLGTETTMVSNLDSTFPTLDVESASDKIFVVYNSTSGGSKIGLFSIDSSQTLSSISNITGTDASNAINIISDKSSRLVISYSDGIDVRYTIFPQNLLSPILSPTLIETIANIRNVSSINLSGSDYTVLYEEEIIPESNNRIKKASVDTAGSVTLNGVLLRSVGLASRLFEDEGTAYAAIVHQSTLQSTYFIINADGTIVTKISPGVGGEVIKAGALPRVISLGNRDYTLITQIKGRNVSEDGTFFSLLGVNNTDLDFDEPNPFQTAELGDNLHISGGILQMYDGDSVVEHGFHLFPEDLIAGSTATTGGFLSDGTRSYVAVYSWTDNYGQQHRSAPSLALQVTLNGATATQTQDVEIPTLRLTEKTDAIIELYRTENAGTIFYKITSVSAPTLNDKTVDSVTITDTISDTSLISNEILYTTGGVLDNIAAPSSTLINNFKSRLAIAGLEDENLVLFSKIRTEGKPVEFSDIITKRVDPVGGKITALAGMDEKLIIFEENAIFYIAGDGPNNLGLQDTFTEPELVAGDVGCIDPNSVVLTPLGLMFRSKKGIFVLTRAMQVNYIGEAVEFFNNLKITGASIIPNKNQVRFLSDEGQTQVYNYNLNRWSTFTNHEGVSSTVLGDDYYYVRNDSLIYKSDDELYSDNGTPIKFRVITSWNSLNLLQGFQRVYRAMILGNYRSLHKLRFRVAYNFEDVFTQEKTIDPLDFIDPTEYGNYSPYGEPDTVPYGNKGIRYQARFTLKQQKSQSVRFWIEDIQDVPGEGMSLSGLSLEVGGKKGLFKVEEARKFGTSGD